MVYWYLTWYSTIFQFFVVVSKMHDVFNILLSDTYTIKTLKKKKKNLGRI